MAADTGGIPIREEVPTPEVIDFHPGYQISPERIAQLRQQTQDGSTDKYGVRQLEPFYSPDGKGVYCLLG